MCPYIQNAEHLIHQGSQEMRKAAVDIIEHSLLAADPYHAVKTLLHLDNECLHIGSLALDLTQFDRILVIGAGKATYPIARALEEILGERITEGVVVLKKGSTGSLNKIRIIYGSHPVPDEEGNRGARLIMELAESCTERDLVLAAVTGGSSALLPLPVDGVSLDDKKRVNEILLFSGAEITQINAVRKHLSQIKGGRLAAKIFPATLVNLTVSDVIGDPLDYITCPTVPDTSTFEDACKVLDDFNLWDKFPVSAANYLRTGNDSLETPRSFPGMPLHSFIVVGSDVACLAASRRCEELGYSPLVLTTALKGEAREAGSFFASIAREIVEYSRPVPPPCALIAGGENTVTIQGAYGQGGPNQEFALAAALEIAGLPGVLAASLDTDGTDGPTDAAGGMVDGYTCQHALEIGVDPSRALKSHDSGPALQKLGSTIFTGHTGTNINDLKIILIDP